MIADFWTNMRRRIASLRRSKRRRSRDGRINALRIEPLEQRELLSTNQITLSSATSTVSVTGTAEADNVQVWSDATNLHVSLTTLGVTESASFSLSDVALIKFVGDAGDDRFENATAVEARAWGGAGNDILIGGAAIDRLYGGAGDDSLTGGDGNDELYGEDGNDQLWGGNGADRLDGGAGADELNGGAGDDLLLGGDGNDTLRGEDGADRLWGQNDADLLNGGAGNDQLYGGAGNDRLAGALGDDELYGEDGIDRLWGNTGADWLEGGADNDFLYGGVDNDTLMGGDGNDTLFGEGGADRLWGQNGADMLDGGSGDDQLYGGAGEDRLIGGLGNDELFGDADGDQLWGNEGVDRLEGGTGNDFLNGGTDNDALVGGDGNDALYGEDGDDQIWGQNGNDLADGGLGNDLIDGGADDDTLHGGEGHDELFGRDGSDLLYGNTGNDTLDGGTGNDVLYGGAGDDSLIGGAGNDELYGEDGIDLLWGQNGNDLLVGGAANDLLYGGADFDTLFGGDGDDELYGQDGSDRLWGENGNDLLDGGADFDQAYGGIGDDTLVGGDGVDVLFGGEGNDRIYGQNGDDIIGGGTGDDLLYGGEGNDAIIGGQGYDSVYGDAGNDELWGDDLYSDNGGNDFLDGGAGNDSLVGGDGDDTLFGGFGRDILIGAAGLDSLYGQADEDVLIGGITSYDGDPILLRTLAAAWFAATPYATRIQQIESGGFVAPLASSVTVFDDGYSDSISGGDGQDWFFQTGVLPTYVPADVSSHSSTDDSTGNDPSHQHAPAAIFDQLPQLEGFDLVAALDAFGDRQKTEAIHSRLPHADNPVLQREHLTLFQLVRYDQVTHYAVNSGAWSDPATWHDGLVPTAGARVLIPINVAVQVDGIIATRIKSIRVDGMLTFDANRNTELRVDTAVISTGGTFEMGTAETPIRAEATARLVIIDDGPIDRTADPFAIGRGLINHGTFSMYGASVTSHVALAGPALAGAVVVQLQQVPFGWKAGDKLVLAGTTGGTQQNEVRQISAIYGGSVLLDQPLLYSHVSPSVDIDVHIANVTRNAVIESQSTALDRRGHVMFMHNPNVEIAFAGFYGLGRTNKLQPINDPVVNGDFILEPGTGTNPRARYAVHFHRAGLDKNLPPATVVGSAVVDSPGWGFVNHSSHVDMLDNVAYDVHGAAFTTEVGDEIGRFIGNFAIGTSGSGEGVESRQYISDFGHRGDGFWFQGVGVTVTDNIAAGNQGAAFFYYARGLTEGGVKKEFISANLPDPSIAGGAETIDVGKMPVTRFENNVGYASGDGLAAWYLMEKDTEGRYSALENSLFWNNTSGISIPYTRQTALSNLKVIYSKQLLEATPQLGVQNNGLTRDIIFNQLTVEGYATGIDLPRRGTVVVNGGTFNNMRDFLILSGNGRNARITGMTTVPRIVMSTDLRGLIATVDHVFLDDVLTLDFGPFENQRLYYMQQSADTVVFTESRPDVPAAYIGLTNQQLWEQFGIALGGAIAPSDAYTVLPIVGLIGPAG